MKMKFYMRWYIFIFSTCLFCMNTVNSQKTSDLKEKTKIYNKVSYLIWKFIKLSLFLQNHRIAEVDRDFWMLFGPNSLLKAELTQAGHLRPYPVVLWIFSNMETPEALRLTCVFCFIRQCERQQRLHSEPVFLQNLILKQTGRQTKEANVFHF